MSEPTRTLDDLAADLLSHRLDEPLHVDRRLYPFLRAALSASGISCHVYGGFNFSEPRRPPLFLVKIMEAPRDPPT